MAAESGTLIRRAIPWASFAVALVSSSLAALLLPSDAYVLFLVMAFASVGLVLVTRRPAHPVGWLFSGFGLTFGLSVLANAYGTVGLAAEPGWPGASRAAWLFGWLWIVYVTQLEVALLLFPTGRFAGRRWRRFAWLVVAVNAATALMLALFGDALSGLSVIVLPLMLVAFGSPLARVGQLSGAEREQVKWVASAGVFLVVAQLVGGIFGIAGVDPDVAARVSNALYVIGVAAVPAAMGVAILRYHLYDIDIVVKRALVYGPTTAAIAVGFFAAIVALQALLRPFTGGSEIAVAISTLLSVALFHPIRGRIQRAVDRRFYRAKYDAERTLDAFATRLRDQVDLDALEGELVAVVGDTVQPAHAGVWLRRR